MPIPLVRIKATTERIGCPFTGQEVSGPDADFDAPMPSLLFAWMGAAAEFFPINEPAKSALERLEAQADDDFIPGPIELLEAIDLPGAFGIEVDGGWNGVNVWVFRPIDTEL